MASLDQALGRWPRLTAAAGHGQPELPHPERLDAFTGGEQMRLRSDVDRGPVEGRETLLSIEGEGLVG